MLGCGRKKAAGFVAAIVILFVCVPQAWAYIDPGSGSVMFQVVIAGIITALFVLKQTFRRILSFLGKLFRRPR